MTILGSFVAILCIVGLLGALIFYKADPFFETTIGLKGSNAKGERLFKANCVGCHGLSGQGLLGPDLHNVSNQLSKRQIINQILKGKTPPMPSFEINPQEMADLLQYLTSISEN